MGFKETVNYLVTSPDDLKYIQVVLPKYAGYNVTLAKSMDELITILADDETKLFGIIHEAIHSFQFPSFDSKIALPRVAFFKLDQNSQSFIYSSILLLLMIALLSFFIYYNLFMSNLLFSSIFKKPVTPET